LNHSALCRSFSPVIQGLVPQGSRSQYARTAV